MNIDQGAICYKNNIITYHVWDTPMCKVEQLLRIKRAGRNAFKPRPIPDGHKKCGNKECGRVLPATTEHFKKTYNKKGKGHHLSYRCRDCLNKANRVEQAKRASRKAYR